MAFTQPIPIPTNTHNPQPTKQYSTKSTSHISKQAQASTNLINWNWMTQPHFSSHFLSSSYKFTFTFRWPPMRLSIWPSFAISNSRIAIRPAQLFRSHTHFSFHESSFSPFTITFTITITIPIIITFSSTITNTTTSHLNQITTS